MGEVEIRAEYEKRLTEIYKKKNKKKLKQISKLLDKNKKDLHGLYLKICKKYDMKAKPKFGGKQKKKKEEPVVLEPIELAEAAEMLPTKISGNDRQRRAQWWRWALDHNLVVGGMIGQEQAVQILEGQFARPCDFDLHYAVAYSFDLALTRDDSLALTFGELRGFLVALRLFLTVLASFPKSEHGTDPGLDFMRFSSIVPLVEEFGYKFRGSKDEWFLTIIHSEPGLIAKKLPMSLFLQWSMTEIYKVMKQQQVERSKVSIMLENCDILPVGRSMAEGRLRKDIFKAADVNLQGKVTLEQCKNALGIFCGTSLTGLDEPIECAFEVCTHLHDEDETRDPDHITFLNFRMFLLSITRFLTLWGFFEKIDTSDDQIIQFEEFEQALPLLVEWGITVEDPLKTFAELDESNMEGISFTEFANWALSEGSFQNAPRDADDLEEDEDYDGVSSAAYRRLLSQSIFSKFANDRNQLFRRIDKNGDRKLNPDEFREGIQRIGITLTDDELSDIFWVFDDMSQNYITQKKFANIVPRECDERMLLLVCNDILDGVYRSRNKPWPVREPTLEDFDPEIRAMKRRERVKQKEKMTKGKKGKKKGKGKAMPKKEQKKKGRASKKDSKKHAEVVSEVEESPKEADPGPPPAIKKQSGKLDPIRATQSLAGVQKLLNSSHEINDYETSTIASEPRSGILEEERQTTLSRTQNRPHNDNAYAKHLEKRNTEILRMRSLETDFRLSEFRMDQVVGDSAVSDTANSEAKQSDLEISPDPDQIVKNIVDQHPQLKDQKEHINTILSIVSDVLMQQAGPSAPGSIEEQINERLADTSLFQGLDKSSTNSSVPPLKPGKINSTSFKNLFDAIPDNPMSGFSPKEKPSALNPMLVNELNQEFSSPSSPNKTPQRHSTELAMMDGSPKAVRFPSDHKEDDTQSIMSEDLHTLKELGIMHPGEVKSEEQKEAERDAQMKKMHRLRAESKRATMLEEEILQFCRFLSSDLAQTEFQPLSADSLDNHESEMKDMASLINSDQSSSNFSAMPTFTSMMSEDGWKGAEAEKNEENAISDLKDVAGESPVGRKRGPSGGPAPESSESTISPVVDVQEVEIPPEYNDTSKEELERITEMNRRMKYRESMEMKSILKKPKTQETEEKKKLSASMPMDSVHIEPEQQLQMQTGRDREKSLMQKRKYKQDALKRSSEAFHRVKKDSNGFIELPAFHEAIRHLNLQITAEQAEALFIALDQLKLGCLSSEEFKNGMLEKVMQNIAHEAAAEVRHRRSISNSSYHSLPKETKKRKRKKTNKVASEDFPECLDKFVGEKKYKHKSGVSTALAFVRDLKSTTRAIDRHEDDGNGHYGVIACGVDDDIYQDERNSMLNYILDLARKFLERKGGFLYSLEEDVFVVTTRLEEEDHFKLFLSQLQSYIIQRIFHEYPGVELKYASGVYKRSEGYKSFTTQIVKKIRPLWCQADMKCAEMLDLAKKLPLRASAEEREKRLNMWKLNNDSGVGGHMNIEEASDMLLKYHGKKANFNLDNAVRFAFHNAYTGADDDEYIIIYSEFRKFLTYLKLFLCFRSVTGDEEDDPGLDLKKFSTVIGHLQNFGVQPSQNVEDQFARMAEGGSEIPMSLLLVWAVKEITAVTARIKRLIKDIDMDADLSELVDLLPVQKTSEEQKLRESIFARADSKKRGYAKLERLRRSIEKFLGRDASDLDLPMKYAFYVQRSISRSKGIPPGEPLRLFLVNVQRYVQMKARLDLQKEDEAVLSLTDFEGLVPVFKRWGLKLSSPRKTFEKIAERQDRVSFPVVAMWALTKGQENETKRKDLSSRKDSNKPASPHKFSPKYGSQLSPAARAINRDAPPRPSSERWRTKTEPQIRRHTYDADDMSDVSSLGRVNSYRRRRDSETSIKMKRRLSVESDISVSRRPDVRNLSRTTRVKRRRDSNDSSASGIERVRRKFADDNASVVSSSSAVDRPWGDNSLSDRWERKGRKEERKLSRIKSGSARVLRSDQIRAEIKTVLLKPVAKPMVEFLGELADEVLTPSFILDVKQKLKDGAESIQVIVVSRLRDMCVEVEAQNLELNGTQRKSRTLTAGSDEFSRDGIDEDDAQLEEAASEKLQAAFDGVKKDETGFMELDAFYSAVQSLNLNFSKSVCDKLFAEIDSLGVGCLSFDEFKKGVLKHVINSFNYAVGPRGTQLYERNDSSSRVVEHLSAHHPLNIHDFKSGFGQTVEGYWVRKSDVIRRIQSNFRSKYRGEHKESVEIQRSRTLTPLTKDYTLSSGPRYSLGSPREQVVNRKTSDRTRRQWDKGRSLGEAVDDEHDMPRSFQARVRRQSINTYGLPSILEMIKGGKSKTVEVDTGTRKQLLCLIALSVNEHIFFEEVCEKVAELSNRFCHVNGGTLYHIDDDLFSVMIDVNEKQELKDFKRKICQYVIKRTSHSGVGIKTSSTIYESGERFGRFCDRAIQALRPTWLVDDSKSRTNELLYKLVADKKNFSKHSQEVNASSKTWRWEETSVVSSLKKLISRGATFHHTDSDGNDVVMFAAKHGHAQILNLFLLHRRMINSERQNREGMTLLMVALYHRKLDTTMLSKILSLEHDFKTQDRRGRTALIHAMNVDNTTVKDRLIEQGAEDIQPEIVDACKYDKLEVIRSYHARNLLLTVRIDDYGSTIACQAAAHGSMRVLRFCMEYTRNLGKDFASATPLHYACHFKHVKLIQLLLDFGANVNAQDSHGESPLLCAATTGSLEVCRRLMKAGADVDLADDKGTTPLMRAAVYGHSKICDVLIESGCNVAANDSEYNNAALMAKRQGHSSLAKKLSFLIFDREQHFE